MTAFGGEAEIPLPVTLPPPTALLGEMADEGGAGVGTLDEGDSDEGGLPPPPEVD